MPTFERSEEAKDEPLILPVMNLDGITHEYTFHPATAGAFLTMTIVQKRLIKTLAGLKDQVPDVERARVAKMSEWDYMVAVCGPNPGGPQGESPVLEQLFADNVGARMLTVVLLTVQKWHLEGTDAAHEVWQRMVIDPPDPTMPTPAGIPGDVTPGTLSTVKRSSTTSRKQKQGRRKSRPGGKR